MSTGTDPQHPKCRGESAKSKGLGLTMVFGMSVNDQTITQDGTNMLDINMREGMNDIRAKSMTIVAVLHCAEV
jgi:hypothetical protein